MSGGEPFLQAEFCRLLVDNLHALSLEVIAETNGMVMDESLIKALDGVRLDIKNFAGETASDLSKKYDTFIDFCDKNSTKVQLTNVLIPSINDGKETLLELKKWLRGREIELLPFRKLCLEKYERLKIPFPYAHLQEATKEDVKRAYEQLY